MNMLTFPDRTCNLAIIGLEKKRKGSRMAILATGINSDRRDWAEWGQRGEIRHPVPRKKLSIITPDLGVYIRAEVVLKGKGMHAYGGGVGYTYLHIVQSIL